MRELRELREMREIRKQLIELTELTELREMRELSELRTCILNMAFSFFHYPASSCWEELTIVSRLDAE